MENINNIMVELAKYQSMKNDLETIIDGLKAEIISYMKENNLETLQGNEHKAIYKECLREDFNKKQFGIDYPDILGLYLKRTNYMRFTFK